MPIFTVENEWNNKLRLTQNEQKWQLTSVTGLNSPPANISTSIIPTFDGSRFNSSRLEARNLVISLAINGDAEANRMDLNSVIIPKRYIKVYYQNKRKSLFIEGYVESFEYDVFEEGKIRAQASIICPSPYWQDQQAQNILFTQIINLFEFPFSIPAEGIALSEMMTAEQGLIKNEGTIQGGFTFTMQALHKVLNPYIQNITTGQKMTIEREISSNEVVSVSTIQGQKSIRLYTGGETKNIINDLQEGSQWITLALGDNIFRYGADYGAENLTIKINFRNQYGGV